VLVWALPVAGRVQRDVVMALRAERWMCADSGTEGEVVVGMLTVSVSQKRDELIPLRRFNVGSMEFDVLIDHQPQLWMPHARTAWWRHS
jgi:hypothetical protein